MAINPQVVPNPSGERKSAIAKIIEELNDARVCESVEIAGYFTLGEKRVPDIMIRVPSKWEQDRAIDMAHEYTKKVAGESDARKDEDILTDAKAACIAWYACRDSDDPMYHAFPSPEWMSKNFSAEQIGTLVRLVNGVRAKHAPTPIMIDSAMLDRLVSATAELGATDTADRLLAGWPRQVLVHAWTLLCMRTSQLEDELTTVRQVIADAGGIAGVIAAVDAATPSNDDEPPPEAA